MSIYSVFRCNFLKIRIITSSLQLVRYHGNGRFIGGLSTILQHGLDVQELPLIVRKANENDFCYMCKSNNNNSSKSEEHSYNTTTTTTDDIESTEMVKGFKRCFTTKEVFKLLDVIPANEITPKVALQALKMIIEFENNHQFRNPFSKNSKNFTKTAVLNNLIDLIANCKDGDVILEGLKVINRIGAGFLATTETTTAAVNKEIYKQKLCDEVLVLVSDEKLSLLQVCEAIKIFTLLGSTEKDKLWIGILEKMDDINETNVMDIFRILPFMKQSQKLIINVLERKINDFWFKLQSNDISEMLIILSKNNSNIILLMISRWINTNIHSINENDLLSIVRGCIHFDNSEQGVEKALERYVKARGLKINNPELFAAIMDYCLKFKVRSPLILDAGSEYLIQNIDKFSPGILRSMFYPFGYLDFLPSNNITFWQIFEKHLNNVFVQLCTKDALDIMLSCIYLEKYPLNFIKKIFNPYFLDRLHSSKDHNVLQLLRSKLKLFDTAMSLECELYRGPLLPKDHSCKSIWQDGRIRRMSNFLGEFLIQFLPKDLILSTSAVLTKFPLIDLYMIDILIHPKTSTTLNLNFKTDLNIAMLIHVPDHYDSTGEYLLGPQVMRKRHLRSIGFKVIDLNYKMISKLKVHPKDLECFLKEEMSSVGVL